MFAHPGRAWKGLSLSWKSFGSKLACVNHEPLFALIASHCFSHQHRAVVSAVVKEDVAPLFQPFKLPGECGCVTPVSEEGG
eukprot:460519-Pelagomonas_calceolata.AAC.5